MPKRSASNGPATPKRKAAGKGQARIAANGHRLPEPLPAGEILSDVTKRQWRLGKAVGLGGFGEIYLASDDVGRTVGADAPFVIKIEPHSNGPLFTEMNFYLRVGKADQIEAWVRARRLDYLGMPKFSGSGSHEHRGVRYRFMVMERFGEDFQKVLDRNGKTLPIKTVFEVGLRVIDVLEYVHDAGYIHADVKASNLLLGFGKQNENKVFLVDYGLACRYSQAGKHKERKEDLRFAHNGTIEFTSRDAHIGATSRRADLEILGYNMLQWLCGALPWEDNVKDVEYVSQQKLWFMANVPLLVSRCFPNRAVPCGITEYLQHVAEMEFEATPDYDRLRAILVKGIRAAGAKHDGRLLLSSPRKSPKPRSSPARGPSTPKKRARTSPAAPPTPPEPESTSEDEVQAPSPAPARSRPANARNRKPTAASASSDAVPLAFSPAAQTSGGRTRRQSAPSIGDEAPVPPVPPAATKGRHGVARNQKLAASSSSDEEAPLPATRRPPRSRQLVLSNSSAEGEVFVFEGIASKGRAFVERARKGPPAEPDAAAVKGTRRKPASGGHQKEQRRNGFTEAADIDFSALGLDNPTPAMLEVLKRKQALQSMLLQNEPSAVAANAVRGKRTSPSPNHPPLTPLRNGHVPAQTRDQKVQTVLSGPVTQRKPRKPLCPPAARNFIGENKEWDCDV